MLTAVLRGYDPAVAVTGVKLRRTSQGTSSHVHLDVSYAEPKAALPRHLFVKTQLSTVHDLPEAFDESLSVGGGGTVLLNDETRFYRDLRPSIDAETPTVYFADHLEGPSQFLIITEDVTDRGARFPDAIAGLTVDEVDELLKTLVQVHAPFWGSPRMSDSGDLGWLEHPVRGPFATFLHADGFGIIRALLEVPYKKKLLEVAGVDADTMENTFWRLAEYSAEEPLTLLHGDPHPANTYVLPDGRVGVLDWQLVRRGSWAHDFGYALVGALEPELRRAHERELLDGYLARLQTAGVEALPDREHMWISYRRTPAWGFCMWAITPDQMYSTELVTAVLRRFAVAYAELGTAELLR
ncbi:putative aminoglycoside phosphotransferase [Mycobacterium xenopi]|uniref:Aminoglycoside phosphotransferase n=1 Tax=Mycobacterium xenopi TaxID=1789 RepID=A0AAD1GYQ7_MYCXE|nr:aminoglycoside phosphotransferase [Mycobacterium xenopi]SPX78938.1 putative aminoglycoside phosphotransferase [Mycobacterium xenopi]